MKKQFLKDETFWTVLLGTLGCFALLWNLIHNPSDWPNILVNFAQIGVAVIVFFLANSIFKSLKGKKDDFNSIFENCIETWSADNKYLIDSSKMNESRSKKTDTRILYMILDLSTFGEKPAADYNARDKGAFLYLPSKDDENRSHKILFKINQQLFSKIQDYENNKQVILNGIASRIRERFSENMNLKVDSIPSEEKVSIDFTNMEPTKENAERLKGVVEFVKTMVLALA
jgi:hypothetical protein